MSCLYCYLACSVQSYTLLDITPLQEMSRYVYVCDDEANRDSGVELPTEEDGNLLVSVLQSQFERASGLKYRSGGNEG